MNKYLITRFVLVGFVFGLAFPAIAWAVDLYVMGLPLTLASITAIHQNNAIHYIFDTAPLILGVTFFIVGIFYSQAANKNYSSSSALLLNTILETMVDGFITVDDHGAVLSYNRGAEDIFGYTEKEIRGKNIRVFMTNTDLKEYDQYLVNSKQTGVSHIAGISGKEVQAKRKDGSLFPLTVTISEIFIGNERRFVGVLRDITDVKLAQAESVRVADELTQLVDTANAPIFGIDSKGLVDEWNQTAAKITGYNKAEVLGKDLVAEFITDEYKAPVKQVLDNALRGQETANYEFPLYTTGGQRVDVLLNATTRRDVDGNIIGVIGVGQDITEAKLAQAESVRVADELTQFVDTANAPIFGIDSKGLVNEWNQTAAKITGYNKAEVLGKDLVAEFITDEYKAPVKQVLDNALRGQETANYEFPLYTTGGQRVDVLLNATTRRDVDGNIIGVIGVGQDITEAKLAQAESVRVADELTQFVDTANAPIFGIDSKGLVNEWNQTAAKITGYNKAEVLGKDLVADFITDEYKAPVKQVLDNALRGQETANYEFPLYTTVGQRVDVLLNATTRRDVDGLITGVIGVGQDITELRQKERALNQSQKMETVGQLTGGIAHDFNNLLSIIGGNLRFLRQDLGEIDQEVEELIEDAMSATNDGADLTARLLAFSRNRILKPELKNVNDAIENFSRFLSRTLGKTIDLKTELPDDQLFINVDTSQLENALLNLAINARDAMPEGGNIVIKAAPYVVGGIAKRQTENNMELALQAGKYVVVSVEDSGVGISDEHLAHVYEPFFTTKDVGKGSGLGLSMVYGFIQQSNGQCIIRSKVGKGTTISMYFPEARNLEETSTKSDIKPMESAGSEVILVVEDEPRVRKITVRDIEKLGYKTIEAPDAITAQDIIKSGEKIDLVFTDVLMPGEMDGQMLGLWIENTHPRIKVVLTSGYTKRRESKETMSDIFPIVRKPYKIDALADQLNTTLYEN
ncbi:PAS domain S-box protein [Candidatus Marimicrobium litorale]|uniref:histidine kinase n=1 Tax=Candidatus Marimicrobium litorale TaxID=2518991 RepID=A0ABT3T8T0_9GAMM|nr:PAS domain S-box protein [Candidatus Marimicrobium litorale]MCX2978696.1 PAS domain S-box protein [Candidatus Marimicrobium litorale]